MFTCEGFEFINEASLALAALGRSTWFKDANLHLKQDYAVEFKTNSRLHRTIWKTTYKQPRTVVITHSTYHEDKVSWVQLMASVLWNTTSIFKDGTYGHKSHGSVGLERTALIYVTEKRFGIKFPKHKYNDLEQISIPNLVDKLEDLVWTKLANDGVYFRDSEYRKAAMLERLDKIRETRKQETRESSLAALEARAAARNSQESLDKPETTLDNR
jgi:hypothetical protein